MRKINFGFLVQGEGFGHTTQAKSLLEIIGKTGNTVGLTLGSKDNLFNLQNFHKVQSFRFVYFNGSLAPISTLLKNLSDVKKILKEAARIDELCDKHNIDILISFYEPLGGLYKIMGGKRDVVSIGHQFAFNAGCYFEDYENIPFWIQKQFLRAYNKLVSFGSKKRYALSYYGFQDKHIQSAPPLLRSAFFDKSRQIKNDHFTLVYLINDCLVLKLMDLAGQLDKTKFKCFTKRFWVDGDSFVRRRNLIFHKSDPDKFVDAMFNADTIVCTAGFETICEGVLLRKKIVANPTPNHVEQYYNAKDAQNLGIITYTPEFCVESSSFDLDKIEKCAQYIEKSQSFWENEIRKIQKDLLEPSRQ